MKKEGILHKRGCVKTHPLQKFAVFILAARRTGVRRSGWLLCLCLPFLSLLLEFRLLRKLAFEEVDCSLTIGIVGKLRIVHAEENGIVSLKLFVEFVVVNVQTERMFM